MQAKAVSIGRFTATVQAAVKAAVQKHPKFKIEIPQGVSFEYLIRGFPVPDTIFANVTLGEAQAFANEVAAHISTAQPEAFSEAHLASGGGQGVLYAAGKHIICGIPPAVEQVLLKE